MGIENLSKYTVAGFEDLKNSDSPGSFESLEVKTAEELELELAQNVAEIEKSA